MRVRKLTRKVLFTAALALNLAGCASKQTAPPGETVYGPNPPVDTSSQNSTPITPSTNSEVPLEPGQTPVVNEPPTPTRSVALVLGGAGVASFATVGILKRFKEEGIRVDLIVSTGWPTLFALGNGYLKSVHDLEWFAMRLTEKDFYKASLFDTSKDYADHAQLSALIENAFRQKDLSDCRIPVVISAANTEQGDAEIFDRGDWKTPLLKTMSVPGIYRPYPESQEKAGWVQSLRGIDVEEATKRGAQVIVAVEMYEDYFDHVRKGRKPSSESVFRKLYLTRLRADLKAQMKQASLSGRVVLGKEPGDFTQRRQAILAGYKEGIRLAKLLRPLLRQ